MSIVPISQREFELYALSLPRGPNFNPFAVHSVWKVEGAPSVGAVLQDQHGRFETIVMRRQVDHRFVVTHRGMALATAERATHDLREASRAGSNR